MSKKTNLLFYYGINANTKKPVLFNRRKNEKPTSGLFIFPPGTGRPFFIANEILNISNTSYGKDEIIIISSDSPSSYDAFTNMYNLSVKVIHINYLSHNTVNLNILNNLMARVRINYRNEIKTWIFIDEIYPFLFDKSTSEYFFRLLRNARMLNVVFTVATVIDDSIFNNLISNLTAFGVWIFTFKYNDKINNNLMINFIEKYFQFDNLKNTLKKLRNSKSEQHCISLLINDNEEILFYPNYSRREVENENT